MTHHQTYQLGTCQFNMLDSTENFRPTQIRKVFTAVFILAIIAIICFGLYIRAQINPPLTFTDTMSFEITSGMSVRDIARAAAEQGVVQSELLLYSILTYSHDPTDIYAGMYNFNMPVNVFGVAKKLADKDIENNLIRVTLPEGIRLITIAEIADNVLPEFESTIYLEQTNDLEGYLFPETYFVPETFTAADLITLQKQTYEENVEPLRKEIQELPMTEYEVLILASIVEREANDETSMKMVAGVLRNRLDIGMALQADASIEYVLSKPLSELTAADLRIDSPYNTYLNSGLVPTPIGNPGIMAIKAVLKPTPSENFFYITDPDGIFHYAKTFADHNQNIARYLR